MRILLVTFFVLLFNSLLNFSVFAGEEVNVTPPPSWVSILDIPKSAPSVERKSAKGIHYLLASDQVRYRNNKRHIFRRYVYKVLEREGLESAGSIQVSFRPKLDFLTMHDVRIIRDQKIIDLSNSIKYDVIQRETEIEKGILNGELTVYARLPKVKVGDIVEYSYSLTFESILMADHLFGNFSMSHNTPSEVLERRLVVPKNFDLDIKYRNLKIQPKVSEVGSDVIYNWTVEDSAIVHAESYAPEWSIVHKSIYFSSVKTWHEVALDSNSHYSPDDELPDSFIVLVDEIGLISSSNEEKLARVLSLVQNEVRYVGIAIGRGAFIPRLPSEVIARGYGDCKDKTLLMVKALNRLNIDAVPVLVHLTKGKDLINRLPSPYVFNHVIVRAKINGKKYWVDPTGVYENNLDPQVAQVNYGYGLPIANNVEGLEKIDIVEPKYFQDEIKETYTVNFKGKKPLLEIEVDSTYRGAGADLMRRNIGSVGEANIEKNYLEYYRNRFENLKKFVDLKIIRDDVSGSIKMVENYQVQNVEDKSKLLKAFNFKSDGLVDTLKNADKGRIQPLKITYPYARKYTVRVQNLAYDYEGFEPIKYDTPYLDYSYTSKVDGDSIEITWTLKTKRDHIKPEEIARYIEIRDAVYENEGNSYDLMLPITDKEVEQSKAFDSLTAEPIFGIALIFSVIASLILGARYGLSADIAYRDEAIYFPISPQKFIIMSILTYGGYQFFWSWKFWRWGVQNRDLKAWPVWRSIVSDLWIYSKITAINKETEYKFSKLSQVCLAAFGVISFFASLIYLFNAVEETFFVSLFFDVFWISTSICLYLPLVHRVNNINGQSVDVYTKNSAINYWNVIGMLGFLVTLYLIYYDY